MYKNPHTDIIYNLNYVPSLHSKPLQYELEAIHANNIVTLMETKVHASYSIQLVTYMSCSRILWACNINCDATLWIQELVVDQTYCRYTLAL